MTLTQPKPHEVHKLLSELLERQAFEQAFQLATEYMDPMDDGFLRFNYLCLAVRLGKIQLALDWLEDSLNTEHWFSAWFLNRSQELEPLFDLPRFEQYLQNVAEKEKIYWQQEEMKPQTITPSSGSSPFPLLVALHGNGLNTLDAVQQWACAPQQGWLVTFPLAPHLISFGKHWWDQHDENSRHVLLHVQSIRNQYETVGDKLLWSGFSKGGEVAMFMALRGYLHQRVFLTVGAGGYLHMKPELWRPIIAQASPEVRGVMLFSPYDLERIGESLEVIFPMLDERGIDYRFIEYQAEGHVFPADFDRYFQEAVEFLFHNPHPRGN
jgi:predicted esterase